jgi:hypothetical protein
MKRLLKAMGIFMGFVTIIFAGGIVGTHYPNITLIVVCVSLGVIAFIACYEIVE